MSMSRTAKVIQCGNGRAIRCDSLWSVDELILSIENSFHVQGGTLVDGNGKVTNNEERLCYLKEPIVYVGGSKRPEWQGNIGVFFFLFRSVLKVNLSGINVVGMLMSMTLDIQESAAYFGRLFADKKDTGQNKGALQTQTEVEKRD